jgi:hypothetical protein
MIIGVTDPVLYIGMPFRMFTLQHDEDHYFVEVQCLILINLYIFFPIGGLGHYLRLNLIVPLFNLVPLCIYVKYYIYDLWVIGMLIINLK